MTESEEMYLVTIARLVETGAAQPIPLSLLASELNVLPVSVNQMIRKMEEDGWVSYTPYKGVSFLPAGEALALQILRHRRLWEVFLVEHLHILPKEAHDLADRLEHIMPPEAAERLAAFLGNPAYSPQGLPIPNAQPDVILPVGIALSRLRAGERGQITQITASTAARAFLNSEGLLPGSLIHLLAIGDQGSILVETEDGRPVHLSGSLVDSFFVEPLSSKVAITQK